MQDGINFRLGRRGGAHSALSYQQEHTPDEWRQYAQGGGSHPIARFAGLLYGNRAFGNAHCHLRGNSERGVQALCALGLGHLHPVQIAAWNVIAEWVIARCDGIIDLHNCAATGPDVSRVQSLNYKRKGPYALQFQ